MDFKLLGTVFLTTFLAELGDKTQLASFVFSAENPGRQWQVFSAAALALVFACAIGVFLGSFATKYVPVATLKALAGGAFVAIGIWTLYDALRG